MRYFFKRPDKQTILPGDLLHVDFGITYLRLNTDTQQHAYVLKAGEKEAPDFLKTALAKANRLQDIFTDNFVTGISGNEILKKSLEEAKAEGLKPVIYTHPIRAIMDMPPGRPLVFGISKGVFLEETTTHSIQTRHIRLNSTMESSSKNGTRRSGSCWRRTRFLMAKLSGILMVGRPIMVIPRRLSPNE